MAEVIPTLYIGLGGTGKEILLRLRRRFYERWGRTSLPCTAFLWLDTDIRDVDATGETIDEIDAELQFDEKKNEKIGLLKQSVGKDLSAVLQQKTTYEYIHRWLPPEVEAYGTNVSNGAGAVRSIGRLTLFHNFPSIQQAITSHIKNIRSEEARQENDDFIHGTKVSEGLANVFVVFSMAGGTGGGTFLDIAFLISKLKSRSNVMIGEVVGYCGLPNLYYEDATMDERASRSYGNAYSALMELEYFNNTEHKFEVEWVKSSPEKPGIMGPPFDFVYLFEMQNEQGIAANKRTEVFHLAADKLFHEFLPDSVGTLRRSHMSNINPYLPQTVPHSIEHRIDPTDELASPMVLQQNFQRRYASFGISKIHIPVESLREACSCRLAAEIIEDWLRDPKEKDLKGVMELGKKKKFDAEGLEGLFGDDWRLKIQQALDEDFPQMLPPDMGAIPSPLQQFVHSLPGKIQTFQNRMVSAVGEDQSQWGRVPFMLREGREAAAEKLRERITGWLADRLEQTELGLRAIIGEAGLAALLKGELLAYFNGEKGESIERKKRYKKLAGNWAARRDTLLNDLVYADESLLERMLGARTWTMQFVYPQLREAIVQQAKAEAQSRLAEETGAIIEQGVTLVEKWQTELGEFREGLVSQKDKLRGLEDGFLKFGDPVLTTLIFDRKADYDDKFYLLGFERGKHLKVKITGEGGEYKGFLAKGYKEGAKKCLMDVVEAFRTDKQEGLRRRLTQHTRERFRADFQTCRDNRALHATCQRSIDVLAHRGLDDQGGLDETKVKKFVRNSLPLLRRISHLGGRELEKNALVYLVVPAGHTEFTDQVAGLLRNYDVRPPDSIITSEDPSQVMLLVDQFAFPLPTVPFVIDDLRTQYHSFSEKLRTNALKADEKERQLHIPLHISKNWQGFFEDLRLVEDHMVPTICDAMQVLTLGPVLNAIRVEKKGESREYFWRRKAAAAADPVSMGNIRDALDYLIRQDAIRGKLLAAVRDRHGVELQKLSGGDDQGLKYYWALQYLLYGLFCEGSRETHLIHSWLDELEKARVASDKVIEDMTDLSRMQRAERAKQQIGDAVKWEAGFPVLKAINPLVLEKS